MKCTVDRKSLKTALATAKHCLPLKPLSDHEANPVLHLVPGKLTVVATDMSQVCSVTVEAETEESFSMSLDLKKLEKIISKTDNGNITIEYGMGGRARVSQTGSDGFVEIPSLPVTKVPVFDRSSPGEVASASGPLDTVVLAEGLDFAGAFMPDVVERNPKYDFVLIKDGLVYGANGVNRRGYFVSPALRFPGELKFLKKFVPVAVKLLKSLAVPQVTVKNLDRVLTLETPDGLFSYACLKARTDAPDIPMAYLKSSGPYTEIDLAKALKAMERITIPEYQSAGASVGVALVLPPADADGNAELSLKLVAAGKLSGKEKIPCKRVGENEEGGLEVDKVVDFKLFKELAGAMPSKCDLKFYANDPEARYFKMQSKHVVGSANCVSVAVGSYARINRVS